MQLKMFEIRGKGESITVLGIKLQSNNLNERYQLTRLGFKPSSNRILLAKINSQGSETKPNAWNNEVMQLGHRYIQKNYSALPTGCIIDTLYLKQKDLI